MCYICGKSSNKIVHYKSCRYVKMIPDKNKKFFNSAKEAEDAGYVQCKYCSYIQKYLRKENTELEKYCKAKGIYFYFGRKDGSLDIISKSGKWKIIVNGRKNLIWLYHKNSHGFDKNDSFIKGYHSQKVRSSTLMGYMKYIVEHDEYRAANPLYSSQKSNTVKGSRKWKKQQKREKKIRKMQGVRYVTELLNNMSLGNIAY